MNWEEFKAIMQPRESGGDPNALYGYSNRAGGEFAGTDLTNMTLDELLAFSAPSGPYAQSVKSQIGRVATPMGLNQVVGTTLRDAIGGLGLSGQEKFSPDTQDTIGKWIYENQGPNAWASMTKEGRPDMINQLPQQAAAAAQPTSNDPMGSLSKSQRLMLAFGALKDAGMALQGKESNSFSDTLTGVNEQQDQARKSRAAQSEIDRLNQFRELLGGAGGGVGGVEETPTAGSGSLAALQKRRSDLVASASLFPDQIETIKLNLAEIDAQIAAEKTSEGQQKGKDASNRITLPRLASALNFLNPDGAVDTNGEPILNPMALSFLGRTSMELTQDPQYAFYKSSIATIKNQLGYANMAELKKQGVTFGSLSEGEFATVASLAGSLDPNDPLGTMQTLKQISEMINKPEQNDDPTPLGSTEDPLGLGL
jgi:hypothetical protein